MPKLNVHEAEEAFKQSDPEKYEAIEKQLTLLSGVRDKIAQLRLLEKEYVAELHNLMPEKKMLFSDYGLIERKNSASRKWDHEEMWNVLTARARDARLIDKETGEVLESEGQAVRRVLQECAGVQYWKVTPLKEKYGVDPDEYAETKWRKSIVITNGK